MSYFEGQGKTESLKRVESAHSHVLDDSGKSEGISFDDLPIIDVTPEDNRSASKVGLCELFGPLLLDVTADENLCSYCCRLP